MSTKPTLIESAIAAYLNQQRHILPASVSPGAINSTLVALCDHEQERLDTQRAPCPVPLLWVALAETVGLVVDLDTGRLVDGPQPV